MRRGHDYSICICINAQSRTFHLPAGRQVWQQNKLNGREKPQGSFLKYTAHEFLKKLKMKEKSRMYEVNAANKKHELWQRDSLSVEIYNKEVAMQKLQYKYFNPLSGKWKHSKDDLDYHYSSAKFYETGIDEFGFLNNCFNYFMRINEECFVCHEPRRRISIQTKKPYGLYLASA